MTGRTYRYYEGEPLFPFGYGLSYTRFEYSDMSVTACEDRWEVEVNVRNVGQREGIEKVQVYAMFTDGRTTTPIYQLCGLQAVSLNPGEAKRVQIEIDNFWVKAVLADGARVAPDGQIVLYIGGHQPDPRSTELTGTECLRWEIQ